MNFLGTFDDIAYIGDDYFFYDKQFEVLVKLNSKTLKFHKILKTEAAKQFGGIITPTKSGRYLMLNIHEDRIMFVSPRNPDSRFMIDKKFNNKIIGFKSISQERILILLEPLVIAMYKVMEERRTKFFLSKFELSDIDFNEQIKAFDVDEASRYVVLHTWRGKLFSRLFILEILEGGLQLKSTLDYVEFDLPGLSSINFYSSGELGFYVFGVSFTGGFTNCHTFVYHKTSGTVKEVKDLRKRVPISWVKSVQKCGRMLIGGDYETGRLLKVSYE